MFTCRTCKNRADKAYRESSPDYNHGQRVRHELNRERRLVQRREHYRKNKDTILARNKLSRRHADPNIVKAAKKRSAAKQRLPENRVKRNAYVRKIRQDPVTRLRYRIGSAIASSLSANGSGKFGKSWELLVGYTLEELRVHLETLFQPGMSWDNYGYGQDKWHVDHKVPQSWFVFEHPSDLAFKECWALNNLQPLWQPVNVSKQDRFAHLP